MLRNLIYNYLILCSLFFLYRFFEWVRERESGKKTTRKHLKVYHLELKSREVAFIGNLKYFIAFLSLSLSLSIVLSFCLSLMQ